MTIDQTFSRTKLFAFAITELLLVMPATLFLGIAAVRNMQPRQNEPVRTIWIIFEWMSNSLTRVDAAVIFLVLPGFALALGLATLLRCWQRDELLRWDTIAFVAVLRRNMHFMILSAGVLAGAAILAAVVVHLITD
jgi:hypothetical protein